MGTPVPISARAVTLVPIPRALPAGSGPGWSRGSSWSGPGTAPGSQSSCPRPAVPRGKIYRLSEPGPEVSRGQKVHFSGVTVHFFQSNEAIICESGRWAGESLEAEQGTAPGSERTGRSPLPFAICHSTGPENKYTTHRNGTRCCGLGQRHRGGMGWKGTVPGSAGIRDVAGKALRMGRNRGVLRKLLLPVNSYRKMPLVTPVRQEGAGGGSWCRVWIVF